MTTMRKNLVAAALTTAAFALTLGLTACSSSTGPVSIDHTEPSATVSAGQKLTIDFGEVNPSVGDGWVVINTPDTSVISAGEQEVKPVDKKNAIGGPATLKFVFEAKKPGTTELEFEYRYRGNVPEDPAEQKQALIKVTVK